ncbi:MAG: prolipoprotein diacylglyceryl transferase family protein [Planctomycetota bacterium]
MTVDWGYQAIMGAAIVTGYIISRWTQRDLSVERWQRYAIVLGAFCGALIGSKVPFLFNDWESFLSGAVWMQNGKTILCGMAGGYLGVEVTKWAVGVTTRTGDSFAVPIAASVAIGRLACFHAGCCYGTPTDLPWAVVFPQIDQLRRHPTQLYESAFHLSAAIVLAWLLSKGMFRGNLVKLYIISYAVYRLFTETIRPEARVAFGMTAYQWAALAMIVVFGGLWYRDQGTEIERAI